jgi:hypothetical protein
MSYLKFHDFLVRNSADALLMEAVRRVFLPALRKSRQKPKDTAMSKIHLEASLTSHKKLPIDGFAGKHFAPRSAFVFSNQSYVVRHWN